MPLKKPQKRGNNVRDSLLLAVGDILRAEGLAGLSLRAAARRAGVSHAAPAHHFRSKAGLLTAFAAQGYARLARTIEEEISHSQPKNAGKALEAVGRGYVHFATNNREQFAIMFRTEILNVDDDSYQMASSAVFGFLRMTLERCVAEGSLTAKDVDTVTVASWSMVHGLSELWLNGRLRERIKIDNADLLAAKVCQYFVESMLKR
jgi:AcrR family transcriptional regulator